MKTKKKTWSILLAVTLLITTLFGNYSVDAATVQTFDTDNETVNTFTIHMKLPLPGTSGAAICGCDRPNLYSYYSADGNTIVPLSKSWPGDLMRMEKSVDDGTWWRLTYQVPSDSIRISFLTGISELGIYDDDGKFIGIKYNVRNTYPKNVTEDTRDKSGYLISGEVWFDPLTMEEPVSVDPDITPTPIVSETPVVTVTPSAIPTETPVESTPEPTPVVTEEPVVLPTTEPVAGPQVSVDYPSGTTYYQEDTDYLNITVTPTYGATNAEVSIDGGPVATITEATEFKVGTGKLANSMVTMAVTSTDGTTTNTQHFYYYKRTKVETPSQAGASHIQVSSAMMTLFQMVKTASEEPKSNYTVTFTVPDESALEEKVWTAPTSKVYAYAYTGNGTNTLFGKWPGQEMTPVKEKTGTYTIEVPASSDEEVRIIFACEGGKEEAQYPAHNEPGYTITGDTSFDANNLPTAAPPNSPEPSPQISENPTAPSSSTPDVTTPVGTGPIETEPAQQPTTSPETKQLTGYFGASLAGPQYTTTKLNLTAVAKNVQGTAAYTFAVNGTILADNISEPVYTWDASQLKAGNYTITVMITDSATGKTITLDKIYPLTEKTEAGDITPEPIIPTAPPTEVPTEVPTEIPTEIPTEVPTAIPTETMNTTPIVEITTAPAIVTETPIATEIVTASAIATEQPATDTPISTDVPAVPVTPAPIVGTISFSKASNKITIGDKVQIKYSQKNEVAEQNYTFTYKVKLGSKTTTIKSNTTNKSVNWTPKSSGTYTVSVLAYDKDKKLVCTTTAKYKVKKTVITLKSFQPKTIKKGKKVTISLRATSSSGSLQYKVIIKNNKGKTVKSKAYSKKRTFTWRPSAKGTYTATIYLKNGKGASIVVKKTIKVK